MIETTINAQTINYLKEEELARMLKNTEFDEKYIVQIFNFFTDVPLQDIARFTMRYQISDGALLRYYETFVKELYPNPELEEMLADVG
ncbi:MAG: hypothetical protein HPY90_12770 [Syntrophothermus sp.]|uniref:hypothetical protein n=1 Tax=Syntrophothermus sp. TaxID=2736299 RepID=UPI00257BFB70|nr:hypothetical protein [Syntrophothermus sp.]NSW84122.1 hypothetical protein [Syntrophothermus sp.]